MIFKRTIATILVSQLLFPLPVLQAEEQKAKVLRIATSTNIDPSLLVQLDGMKVNWDEQHATNEKNSREMEINESVKNLAEANSLYKELKLDEALENIDQARKNPDFVTFRESYFLEGLIGYTLRKNKIMGEALHNFVQLGGAKPNERYYSPEFIKNYKLAKKHVLARSVGVLNIRPEVKSEVLVDGNSVGQGDVQVRDLRVGLHFVEVRASGYEVYSQVVQLEQNGLSISPQLKMLPTRELIYKALVSNQEDEKKYYLALAQKRANCTSVLWMTDDSIKVYKNGGEVFVSSSGSQKSLSSSDYDLFKRAVYIEPISKQTVVVSQLEPRKRASESSSTNWYGEWWVWTIVGVALAGGAGFMISNHSSDTVHLTVGNP